MLARGLPGPRVHARVRGVPAGRFHRALAGPPDARPAGPPRPDGRGPAGDERAVLAAFFIGWAKPTPVNPMNLQGGRRGEAIVAVAGPLSNLVMAAIVAIVVRLLVGERAGDRWTPISADVFERDLPRDPLLRVHQRLAVRVQPAAGPAARRLAGRSWAGLAAAQLAAAHVRGALRPVHPVRVPGAHPVRRRADHRAHRRFDPAASWSGPERGRGGAGKVRQVRRYLGARVSLARTCGAGRTPVAGPARPVRLDARRRPAPRPGRHGGPPRGRRDGSRTCCSRACSTTPPRAPSVGLLHRVSWSLGERYGSWAWWVAGRLPGFGAAHARLRDHAEVSAALALAGRLQPAYRRAHPGAGAIRSTGRDGCLLRADEAC